MMTIAIVGAGIGGLTTAIALRQKGFSVTVYEAADELKSVGAGIILANNAMQVYQRLGLYNQIDAKGCRVDQMVLTDPKLSPLLTNDLKSIERKTGVHNVAIHRADLQAILVDALPEGSTIKLGKKLQRLDQQEQQVKLDFLDETLATAEVVIGADGIHSMTRNYVQPNSVIRRPKQVCWRGVVNHCLSSEHIHKLQESWGQGKRFGFTQINEKQVYWYALHNYQTDYKREFTNVDLPALYQNFHPIVAELIRLTPTDHIIFNEIIDLKPLSSWFSGNLGLIGDAAHATTPNLGQGACQAIEDAYLLADLFAKHRDYSIVFPQFNKLRKDKVDFVVSTSWQLGKMAHIENPLGCRARNLLMRLMPSGMSRMQNERLFTLIEAD